MGDWYREHLIDTGRSPALWMLIGFVVTFGITRGITTRIRSRKVRGEDESDAAIKDVVVGGIHIHHQVWGILLLLITGAVEFRVRPDHPWAEVLAALFGVGAALALDEFALWLHLEDVYWSVEGRKSLDAVLIATVVLGSAAVGSSPFGIDSKEASVLGGWFVAATLLLHLAFTTVCILKGKVATGLIGMPMPGVAFIGVCRLAKPSSYWARRRYDEQKMARAVQRFDRSEPSWAERLRARLVPSGPR
jgi:hypothetical protein